MSGIVVSVDARVGQTINATYTAPVLMRVADLSIMTVWTQVSEADVPQIKVGMPLYFTTLGYPDRRWTATLRQILPAPPKPPNPGNTADTTASPAGTAPGAANNVVLYTALFDVPNPQGDLRPEMTAQAFFITASAKDTVLVPRAALTPVPGSADEFETQLLGPAHRPEIKRVRTGVMNRFMAQVLSGLAVGDRVAIGQKRDAAANPLLGFRL